MLLRTFVGFCFWGFVIKGKNFVLSFSFSNRFLERVAAGRRRLGPLHVEDQMVIAEARQRLDGLGGILSIDKGYKGKTARETRDAILGQVDPLDLSEPPKELSQIVLVRILRQICHTDRRVVSYAHDHTHTHTSHGRWATRWGMDPPPLSHTRHTHNSTNEATIKQYLSLCQVVRQRRFLSTNEAHKRCLESLQPLLKCAYVNVWSVSDTTAVMSTDGWMDGNQSAHTCQMELANGLGGGWWVPVGAAASPERLVMSSQLEAPRRRARASHVFLGPASASSLRAIASASFSFFLRLGVSICTFSPAFSMDDHSSVEKCECQCSIHLEMVGFFFFFFWEFGVDGWNINLGGWHPLRQFCSHQIFSSPCVPEHSCSFLLLSCIVWRSWLSLSSCRRR